MLIGIHDSCLENIELIKKPEYVLTIENLSSFNEYTQKIQDDGIVLYTGGFPTSTFQLFYKQLIEMAESQTYHWGDTDPHGFLILRTLQNIAGNAIVLPHLLDHPGGSAYSSSDKSALERIMPVNTIVDNLLLKLIDRGTGYIEQEEVEAISPVCRHLTNNIQSSRQENS